jgi:SAM-dependent methyltransferase
LKLFLRFTEQDTLPIRSFVDVGCGSGDVIKLIADSLKINGFHDVTFKGYDVSPHVLDIENEGVEYIQGDFIESAEFADVVTLFDVFEHVPNTMEFIKGVAARCNIVGLHIPLDYSLNVAMRDMFRSKLRNPGHLIFLDTASALNVLAFAGLRVIDYEYTFSSLAPSGHRSVISRMAFPLRYLLSKISPWLLSKTLGGESLMVIAVTPRVLQNQIKHVS